MPPPRVKVYGFLSLTKRQYLLTLVGALCLLLILTPLWFLQGHEYVRQFLQLRAPALIPIVQYVPYLVLGAMILEGIEVWLVLRKFKKLEEAQRLKDEFPHKASM